MDPHALFEISAAGMHFEQKRLEIATLNIANMHSSAPAGLSAYQPLRVVLRPLDGAAFGRALAGVPVPSVDTAAVAVVATGARPRIERDPGHPHADESGFVRYPGVDQALEMVTAMTALRAYEANVAAIGMAKAMASRALEIGGSR